MDNKPCCSAEALRRVKQILVDGKSVGIAWLDPIIEEVATLHLPTDAHASEELLKRVKVYNYIPRGMQEAYAQAVFAEYRAYTQRNLPAIETDGGEHGKN